MTESNVLVPRWGNNTLVYDSIGSNHILITSGKKYSNIPLRPGILTKQGTDNSFVTPQGLIYGSGDGDSWTLESSGILDNNGILLYSKDPQEYSTQSIDNGLIYGYNNSLKFANKEDPNKIGLIMMKKDGTVQVSGTSINGKGFVQLEGDGDNTYALNVNQYQKGLIYSPTNNNITYTESKGLLYGKTENNNYVIQGTEINTGFVVSDAYNYIGLPYKQGIYVSPSDGNSPISYAQDGLLYGKLDASDGNYSLSPIKPSNNVRDSIIYWKSSSSTYDHITVNPGLLMVSNTGLIFQNLQTDSNKYLLSVSKDSSNNLVISSVTGLQNGLIKYNGRAYSTNTISNGVAYGNNENINYYSNSGILVGQSGSNNQYSIMAISNYGIVSSKSDGYETINYNKGILVTKEKDVKGGFQSSTGILYGLSSGDYYSLSGIIDVGLVKSLGSSNAPVVIPTQASSILVTNNSSDISWSTPSEGIMVWSKDGSFSTVNDHDDDNTDYTSILVYSDSTPLKMVVPEGKNYLLGPTSLVALDSTALPDIHPSNLALTTSASQLNLHNLLQVNGSSFSSLQSQITGTVLWGPSNVSAVAAPSGINNPVLHYNGVKPVWNKVNIKNENIEWINTNTINLNKVVQKGSTSLSSLQTDIFTGGTVLYDPTDVKAVPAPRTGVINPVLYYNEGDLQWQPVQITAGSLDFDPDITGLPEGTAWSNIVTYFDEDNNRRLRAITSNLETSDYGIYNSQGKLVKLNAKILNDMGLNFFQPSENNDNSYIGTNLTLFSSSFDSVDFNVNAINIFKYFTTTQYNDGYYTYVSRNSPLPDNINTTLVNTYNGLYSIINANQMDTNNLYIKFNTTIHVDSITLPKQDSKYKQSNDTSTSYSSSSIANKHLVIGVYTNFNKNIGEYYQNVFYCNQNTLGTIPTSELFNDDRTLLGYMIINLGSPNIDNQTATISINEKFEMESTIKYNSNFSVLTNEDLVDGLISFRPMFYINNNQTTEALHYNNGGVINNISSLVQSLNSTELTLYTDTDTNTTLKYNDDYYYKDEYIVFNPEKFAKGIDQTGYSWFSKSNLALKNYMYIWNTGPSYPRPTNTNIFTTHLYYCDYDQDESNLYALKDNKYIKAYSYYNTTNNTISLHTKSGYYHNNGSMSEVCLYNNNNSINPPSIKLDTDYYSYVGDSIYNNLNGEEISLPTDTNVVTTEGIKIVLNSNIHYLNNNICDSNDNIIFPAATFEYNNVRVRQNNFFKDTSNNLHVLLDSNTSSFDVSGLTSGKLNIEGIQSNEDVVWTTRNGPVIPNGYYINGTFNSQLCTSEGQKIYVTRPCIYDGEYTTTQDIIIRTTNDASQEGEYKYTTFGVTDHNNDVIIPSTNILYGTEEKVLIDNTKYEANINGSNVIISSKITGEDVITSTFVRNFNIIDYYILNSSYKALPNFIYRSEGINLTGATIRPVGDYITISDYRFINGLPYFENGGYSAQNNKNLITRDNDVKYYIAGLKPSNYEISISWNADKMIYNRDNNNIYFGDEFITSSGFLSVVNDEILAAQIFSDPIEKDITIKLKPIAKNSILNFSRGSSSTTMSTLSTNIKNQLSIANISVTLTANPGTYPSIIN